MAVAAIAFALRMFLSGRGFNTDTQILFEISSLRWGGNFYKAHPYAANWGPICYWIFQAFRRLPDGENIVQFHQYMSILFSSVDVLTGWILWRIFSLRAAAIFLFSPAAAIMAGYHCNAEPAIVASALAGYYWHWKENLGKNSGEDRPGAGLYLGIGISLAVKHLFVLFPVWLVLRPVGWKERLRCLALSYGTWMLIVSPFLYPDPGPFISNVLLYSSWSGNALIPFTVKAGLRLFGASFTEAGIRPIWVPLFLSMMVGLGWRVRNCSLERAFLLYPLALLATSSAVALQYFAPPCFSIAADFNWLGGIYHLFTGWYLGGDLEEVRLWAIPSWLFSRDVPGAYAWNPAWLLSQLLILAIVVRRLTLRVSRPSTGSRVAPEEDVRHVLARFERARR